jgi:lipopolysaccharide/colanic/teichoic acid biosynthesis glycosyltransferase
MSSRKPALLPWVKKTTRKDDRDVSSQQFLQITVMQEAAFSQMLRLERRRTERSARQFMLVLISSKGFHAEFGGTLVHRITTAIALATRETDILGWYEGDLTLGLLMTEIGEASPMAIEVIKRRISTVVQGALRPDNRYQLTITFRLFPQEMETKSNEKDGYTFYPDLSQKNTSKKRKEKLKRIMDIIGSLAALMIFLPVIVIVAVFIKVSSKGPVLFSQNRIGQYGREFKFFKFRTMYVNNDSSIHREYTAKLIAGHGGLEHGKGLFKLVNDPRITLVGRFLRKTSLDELPQFVNVLMGSMSLVGPRPPLSYEYQRYQTWHKRRVLELKPGLTGLWQVEGRSRTTFDDMVRLDLRYAATRSIWVDLKILLRTPAAMLTGYGAC